MKKRVWRFDFKVNIEELNDIYNIITKEDQEKLSKADISGSFDIELKNKCQSYLIADSYNISIYKSIFNIYNVKCKVKDITPDLVSGKIDIGRDIIDFLMIEKSENCIMFLRYVDVIIYSTLTIDGVLDKISKNGINSISEIEKKFLDNSK